MYTGSSDTEQKTDYIRVVPDANFTANATAGKAPIAVKFTDTSNGTPTAWAWEFGDGASATEQHPVHVYTRSGNFTVNLTARNGYGATTLSHAAFVKVEPSRPLRVFPGSTALPRDLDGDGLYEDVNGNGRKDFADVVLFFNQMSWCADNEPVEGSGTSMAVPHVAGAAALALSLNRSLSTPELKRALLEGADPVSALAGRTVSGGRLNASSTLARIAPPLPVLPGAANPPTDPDGDGQCDDTNGNGRADFADVVLYFTQMSWIAANEPLSAFDCNGNGRIDFADVVWLFNHL